MAEVLTRLACCQEGSVYLNLAAATVQCVRDALLSSSEVPTDFVQRAPACKQIMAALGHKQLHMLLALTGTSPEISY